MAERREKSGKEVVIYQAKSGKIEFRGDFKRDTIWGSLNQIADLFGRDKSVISRHIKNIYKTGELTRNATVAKIATVQKEGNRRVTREIENYNLDIILSVGYRVDSKQATQFRIWATRTLKQHLLDGYTINKKRIAQNYENFLSAVAGVKALLPAGETVNTEDVLELINAFAGVWLSLDAYDTETLPKEGATKKDITITAEELRDVLQNLKQDLLDKEQASEHFGRERQKGNLDGIVGNVFQSFCDTDMYPSVEEKAAHLLYFMIKNHPFTDGNKRCGALAFVWFLRKAGLLRAGITPEALTTLTLLTAGSDPKDKNKVIGLVLQLLNQSY